MDNEPNGFADFCERFYALQEEAKGYGIQSVVCLEESDPFQGDTGTCHQYVGSLSLAIGLVERARFSFLEDTSERRRD